MINVAVALPINEHYREVIKSIDPQVKLWEIYELARRDYKGDFKATKELDAILAQIEILYGRYVPLNLLVRAPKLKWIQEAAAGMDKLLDDEYRRSPVKITNVSRITASPIAEFVMEMMLNFVKQAPLFFELKQKKEWYRPRISTLRGKTVGIVGLGSIGREVARLSKAFRMHVIATRRSIKKAGSARNVDLLLPTAQLPELLVKSDFVVISLPLTDETNKLIGDKELILMKPTAYIINVGRGKIIDEPALIRALAQGKIAGAGLDVFETEPLPKGNRLWELPNVIMSHHVAGDQDAHDELPIEFFCKNLKRYIEGKKLLGLVNKDRGY